MTWFIDRTLMVKHRRTRVLPKAFIVTHDKVKANAKPSSTLSNIYADCHRWIIAKITIRKALSLRLELYFKLSSTTDTSDPPFPPAERGVARKNTTFAQNGAPEAW